MRAWMTRALTRSKELWLRILREHASPREIAIAIAIGVFIGCTPAFGAHMWIALGLATVFRYNRLFCFLGTKVSNVVFLPTVIFSEVELGHRLRQGQWLVMHIREAPARARELMIDWIVGCVPVGIILAIFFGSIAFVLATIRDRRRSEIAPK